MNPIVNNTEVCRQEIETGFSQWSVFSLLRKQVAGSVPIYSGRWTLRNRDIKTLRLTFSSKASEISKIVANIMAQTLTSTVAV